MHALGCCRAGVASQIAGGAGSDVDGDVSLETWRWSNDQVIDRAADRSERAFGSIGHRNVIHTKAGNRFTESEGVGDVAADHVARTALVVSDDHAGGLHVYRLRALNCCRAGVTRHIAGSGSGHIDRHIPLKTRRGRHHQGVDRGANRSERALGSIGNRNVLCTEAHNRFTEREGVGDITPCHIARTSLVIGDDYAGRLRIHCLHALGCRRAGVARQIAGGASSDVDGDVPLETWSWRHHQGIDRAANRGERAFGSIAHHNVIITEAHDRFIEGEGVRDITACHIARACFVIGDEHAGCDGIGRGPWGVPCRHRGRHGGCGTTLSHRGVGAKCWGGKR